MFEIYDIKTDPSGFLIKATFNMEGERKQIYFRSKGCKLTPNTEAFIAIGLLPCMKRGVSALSIKGKVSSRFLTSLETIQYIFRSWYPKLSHVEIKNAISQSKNSSKKKRVGMFFSGGVDSFYSLLKHRNEISHLIFLHGYDIALDEKSLRRKTSNMVHQVASFFDKKIVEIETNLRLFLDPYFKIQISHGAFLAGIGHLLYPQFNRIYIPASRTYDDMHTLGSHLALDPLWSTEALEFVHDGCEASRAQKVMNISTHDIVLQNLRVCNWNPEEAYNCGRCEKCIRTMMSLYAAGALERCTTFENKLDMNRIPWSIIANKYASVYFLDNLIELERSGKHPELVRSLKRKYEVGKLLRPGIYIYKKLYAKIFGKRKMSRFLK